MVVVIIMYKSSRGEEKRPATTLDRLHELLLRAREHLPDDQVASLALAQSARGGRGGGGGHALRTLAVVGVASSFAFFFRVA